MKEKNFGSKEKIFYEKVFTIYIFSKNNINYAKMSQNIFAYFSVSEHSPSFSLFYLGLLSLRSTPKATVAFRVRFQDHFFTKKEQFKKKGFLIKFYHFIMNYFENIFFFLLFLTRWCLVRKKSSPKDMWVEEILLLEMATKRGP